MSSYSGNLYTAEKQYLKSLMEGAEPVPGIELSEPSAKIFEKIIELKKQGMTVIPPGTILGTGGYVEIEASAALASYFGQEVKAARQALDLQKALKKERYGTPEDQAREVQADLDRILERAGRENVLMSGEDLALADFSDIPSIIPDILPVGLSVWIGPPKQGKTWLALQGASAIAMGISFLTKRAIRAPVLYYALEEGFPGCKGRVELICNHIPRIMYFRESLDGNNQIISDIEKTKARAVFIDTFIAYTKVEDVTDYSETTRKTRELKKIADAMRVGIVLIHHSRKVSGQGGSDWVDNIMGSQGIAGAADALLYLRRKRGEKNATVHITGRVVKDAVFEIHWQDTCWKDGKVDE